MDLVIYLYDKLFKFISDREKNMWIKKFVLI